MKDNYPLTVNATAAMLPVSQDERILALDVMRGFALFAFVEEFQHAIGVLSALCALNEPETSYPCLLHLIVSASVGHQ